MLSFSTPGTWGQDPSESIPAKLAALEATVASLVAENSALAARVAALEAEQALSDYVTVDQNEIEGLKGPHVIFTGVNVHIRKDSEYSNDINGLGNLIVGYNEKDIGGGFHPVLRTGSHNLVVGTGHSYPGSNGFVAGYYNQLLGSSCSISGWISWVGGGIGNHATGDHSSVSGGKENDASGYYSSISGGSGNTVSSDYGYAPFP